MGDICDAISDGGQLDDHRSPPSGLVQKGNRCVQMENRVNTTTCAGCS